MRTFIAIDLDPELKAALESLIGTLKATGADIRWTQPGGLHLTLKFLGEVDEGQVAAVKKVIAEVAARHAAFALSLEGTGAFPGDRNPRVLWAGFSAAPDLLALQDELDKGLERLGFATENRAFHPHLTLGRVKGPDRVRNALLELGMLQQETFGVMTVRKLTLFESRLHPEGAEYRALAEFGLS